MSTATTVINTVGQIITDLSATTSDLKKLLADQATVIATLQNQIAGGSGISADQLVGLESSTQNALAGVDALDASVKAADATLQAVLNPPAAAEPATPSAPAESAAESGTSS